MANYVVLPALALVCDSVFQCTGSFLSHTTRHQLPALFCVTANSVNTETSHAFRDQCLEFMHPLSQDVGNAVPHLYLYFVSPSFSYLWTNAI